MEILWINLFSSVVLVGLSFSGGEPAFNSSRLDVVEDGSNFTLDIGNGNDSTSLAGASSLFPTFHVADLWNMDEANLSSSNATGNFSEFPANISLHSINYLLSNESLSTLVCDGNSTDNQNSPSLLDVLNSTDASALWNASFHEMSHLWIEDDVSNITFNSTIPEQRSSTNVNSSDWDVSDVSNSSFVSLVSAIENDTSSLYDAFNSSFVSLVSAFGNDTSSMYDASNSSFVSWVLAFENDTTSSVSDVSYGTVNRTKAESRSLANVHSWDWHDAEAFNFGANGNSSAVTDDHSNSRINTTGLSWEWNDESNATSENGTVKESERNQRSYSNESFSFSSVTEESNATAQLDVNLSKTNLSVMVEYAATNFTDLPALNFADLEYGTEIENATNITSSFLPQHSVELFADSEATTLNASLSNLTVVDGWNRQGFSLENSTITRTNASQSNKNEIVKKSNESPSSGSFWGLGNTFKTLHPWVNWFVGVTSTETPTELPQASEATTPADEVKALGNSSRDFRSLLHDTVYRNGNGSSAFESRLSDENSTMELDVHVHNEDCDHALDLVDNTTENLITEDVDGIDREQRSGFETLDNRTIGNQSTSFNVDFAVTEQPGVNVSDSVPSLFEEVESMVINLDENRFENRNQRALNLNDTFSAIDTENSTSEAPVLATTDLDFLTEGTTEKTTQIPTLSTTNIGFEKERSAEEATQIPKLSTTNSTFETEDENVNKAILIPASSTQEPIFEREASTSVPVTTTDVLAKSIPFVPMISNENPSSIPPKISENQERPEDNQQPGMQAPVFAKPLSSGHRFSGHSSQSHGAEFRSDDNEQAGAEFRGDDNQQPGMQAPAFVEPLSTGHRFSSHSSQYHGAESEDDFDHFDSEEKHHEYQDVSEIQQPGMSAPVFEQPATRRFSALSAYCPKHLSRESCPDWLIKKDPHCQNNDDCQVAYPQSMCCLVKCRKRCIGNVHIPVHRY